MSHLIKWGLHITRRFMCQPYVSCIRHKTLKNAPLLRQSGITRCVVLYLQRLLSSQQICMPLWQDVENKDFSVVNIFMGISSRPQEIASLCKERKKKEKAHNVSSLRLGKMNYFPYMIHGSRMCRISCMQYVMLIYVWENKGQT